METEIECRIEFDYPNQPFIPSIIDSVVKGYESNKANYKYVCGYRLASSSYAKNGSLEFSLYAETTNIQKMICDKHETNEKTYKMVSWIKVYDAKRHCDIVNMLRDYLFSGENNITAFDVSMNLSHEYVIRWETEVNAKDIERIIESAGAYVIYS